MSLKSARRKACKRKVHYQTQTEAEDARGVMIRKLGIFPGRISAYRCCQKGWVVGGNWH
jgi:hypothetical protein